MDVLCATVPTCDVVVPVAIGSSVPTWMRAGRLSDARIEGDERTLNRESACKAFTNALTYLARNRVKIFENILDVLKLLNGTVDDQRIGRRIGNDSKLFLLLLLLLLLLLSLGRRTRDAGRLRRRRLRRYCGRRNGLPRHGNGSVSSERPVLLAEWTGRAKRRAHRALPCR